MGSIICFKSEISYCIRYRGSPSAEQFIKKFTPINLVIALHYLSNVKLLSLKEWIFKSLNIKFSKLFSDSGDSFDITVVKWIVYLKNKRFFLKIKITFFLKLRLKFSKFVWLFYWMHMTNVLPLKRNNLYRLWTRRVTTVFYQLSFDKKNWTTNFNQKFVNFSKLLKVFFWLPCNVCQVFEKLLC